VADGATAVMAQNKMAAVAMAQVEMAAVAMAVSMAQIQVAAGATAVAMVVAAVEQCLGFQNQPTARCCIHRRRLSAILPHGMRSAPHCGHSQAPDGPTAMPGCTLGCCAQSQAAAVGQAQASSRQRCLCFQRKKCLCPLAAYEGQTLRPHHAVRPTHQHLYPHPVSSLLVS
jgi:hypothetical protein